MASGELHLAECLAFLAEQPAGRFDLVYVDPPFNTGKRQRQRRLKTVRDPEGDRQGFGGARYRTEVAGEERGYDDVHEDYLAFLEPRLREAHRVLAPEGALFVHLDDREVHYVKVLLDRVFGRDCFQNEIIWAYDYGARSKKRWSRKHDSILWYTKHPERYCFDHEAMDRIPYMAPGLVGKEKAARGKTPTDVWWHTIVSPTGKERTGYPNQKPLGILERIVKVHSRPGELCLDFFAGSGSFGEACARNDRRFVLVDQNPEAHEVMRTRLSEHLTAG
ncbi:MAG: site-specific DNA-methyltransferase [Deltaproteobacteria bacterium]|nr:site-specific DNA-methyltransferase [Deltaproteobacteria bacterium]